MVMPEGRQSLPAPGFAPSGAGAFNSCKLPLEILILPPQSVSRRRVGFGMLVSSGLLAHCSISSSLLLMVDHRRLRSQVL